MTRRNPLDSREAWLRRATDGLRPVFAAAGQELPPTIRFAIAFLSSGRRPSRRVGECWPSAASADGHHEIFVRLDREEPVEILGILVHELVHAALPEGAGHGPLFRRAALAVGLTGPMRSTEVSAELRLRLERLAARLGPVPHRRLDVGIRPADGPKKQGTRLLKAQCRCGYTVRVTAKWVDEVGPPWCPAHGAMTIERPPESA
jgi:hypothetical protein